MSNYSNRGKKFGDMVDRSSSWMGCVDLEVQRAKKATLSVSSKYYKKPTKWTDHAVGKHGVAYNSHSEIERLGSNELWLEGYRYFCRQKVNTKGQKVDRSHLMQYQYNAEKFGAAKQINETQENE